MDEKIVEDVLADHGIAPRPHASVFGTVRAGIAAYHAGLGASMSAMREHVVHLGAEGVAIIPVDDRNGVLRERELVFIPNERIRSLEVRSRLLHLELVIGTEEGDIVYRLRRSAVNCPWHRDNLSRLLLSADVAGE